MRSTKSCIFFAVTLMTVALPTGISAQDASVVASFSGSGATNTRPFTAEPGWEVQWDAKGSIFQIYLHSGDGELLGVAANQQGAGTGESYQPRAGEYYLQVNAIGSWEIRVVQVSGQDSATEPVTFSGSGAENTRPFSLKGRWEVEWESSGSIFQLYLYSADGNLVGVAANQQGAGEGASFQPRGGDYYFQVNAIGEWTIRITPLGES